MINSLLFVDDLAFLSLTREGLQKNLGKLAECFDKRDSKLTLKPKVWFLIIKKLLSKKY